MLKNFKIISKTFQIKENAIRLKIFENSKFLYFSKNWNKKKSEKHVLTNGN